MERICQSEHTNHTHVTVPKRTDSVRALQPKLGA